ncbi:MAG: hypothetical protein HKN21_11050, partial [Candidatus Eisenbacteria bacterium]|nr:hypothetical protein [Candidatus Eisenbacteria bacterium]
LQVVSVPRAVKLARTELQPLGTDWLITAVPESAQWWDPETLGEETPLETVQPSEAEPSRV